MVDGISYSVHASRAEIHFESEDKADLHLLLSNDKHRRNLASRAAIAQREAGSWSSERQDSWNVHAGGKKLRVAWDGSLPAEKKAAAIVVTAESMEDMAQRKFNKDYGTLSPQEKAQLADEMHLQEGQSPAQAPVPPSFSAPSAPLAPGASKTINWFVTADNPDFKEEGADAENPKDQKANDDEPAKKDKPEIPPKKDNDGKKDKPKDDKAPKKDDKPKDKKAPKKDKDEPGSKKYEEQDIKMAEEALESLEKLLDREEKEGEFGPQLDAIRHAIEEIKNFLGSEKDELSKAPAGPGMPVKIDLKPMPMDKGPMPPSINGPAMGPSPSQPPMPFASWTEENRTGFYEGDSVWRKADMGIVNSVGLDPGRVVAIGGGKVIVDWGDDEVLAEEAPVDIVLAKEATGERDLFADPNSINPEVIEENQELSQEEIKAEIEAVLSKTSLQDLLKAASPDGSNDNAIVHIGTGIEGEFVAKGSDGRLLVKVAGEEFFVWPYEVRFSNAQEEK
jgi:hypothetical protein